ncbi:hypothetical protein [Globicatella sanguinis]|uniref:hypothetical protein n=1 Tax=Globicatella sanguinis TaxID=13076 RepID=UPI0025432706|nr:hypothetical protein [Globicatella sanguinis]MDK7631801.1 hypothetical protein [Globicatella sanguinis]WIK66137.1 hypothetical protein CYJ72_009495 [Globicatella sanguinis]WKT55542.1 hypothetical protein Q3C38_09495 [Globicatella sanguinis]
MSDINCIKKLRNEKGLSISEIQRVMKINWRTAKKYADEDQIPQEKVFEKKGMMYEEKWCLWQTKNVGYGTSFMHVL